MRFLDAARSAPARYALIFAALSAVVMGVLLALIYGWTTALLERHLEEAIEQQVSILRDDLAQDGRDSIVGLVRRHANRHNPGPVHLLVQDAEGKVLAGDLPSIRWAEGWQDIELPPGSVSFNGARLKLRGLGSRLDDDTFVLVTHDTKDLSQTRALLTRSFGIALGVTVTLALIGGLVIGGVLVRRVEEVNRTARAIMDGDLSRRIPVVDRRDELGGLAESLNRMLARIEELMENLRHVTSDIAHDLRSPLGRLRQRLEACRVKQRSSAEYEAAIDAAIEESQSILTTFSALLSIAQIEAGTSRDRFKRIDLSKIAANVADAFAAVAEDSGGLLNAHIEPNVSVNGDPELLTQMLANLVENALRHTPSNSTVEVRIERTFGKARLTVSDNGPGIPPGERDRILRRFYRLDSSRSTPGSGLGMSLVAAIVKLHDATMSLEDNEPGLRVVVAFP